MKIRNVAPLTAACFTLMGVSVNCSRDSHAGLRQAIANYELWPGDDAGLNSLLKAIGESDPAGILIVLEGINQTANKVELIESAIVERLDSTDSIHALRDIAADPSRSHKARIWATRLLGKSNDPSAAKLVAELLNSTDPQVRLVAIDTVSDRNDLELARLVLHKLKSDAPIERAAAARCVGRVLGESALVEIAELLVDPSTIVFNTAVTTIREIGTTEAYSLLESALGTASKDRLETLRLALELFRKQKSDSQK